jgi:hypothetical protein
MRSTSMTRTISAPPMMKMGGFKTINPTMMRSTSMTRTISAPPMMKMGGMKMGGMMGGMMRTMRRGPAPVF